jgi:hypothetical protein
MELRFVRQMRQCISGNVGFRLHCRTIVLAVLLLVNFFAFPTSIRADSPIFKYEDDSGIITFTEQWDSIPIKYRDRVVTLNAATLKPVEGGSSAHLPHTSPTVTGEKAKDSVWDSWRDRLNGLSIPLPSEFQLGIGLTSGLLIVGTLMVLRYTSNPFIRVVLKFVVVAVVGGTGYLLYFSILNAEVSISNGEPRRPTTTIDDFMQTLRNLHAPLSYDIDNSVLHPIQSVIEQSKDATVGKASRTVNQSNAATTQMEDTLKETEVDQAQVDGQ